MSALRDCFAHHLARGDQVRLDRRRCNVLAVKPWTKPSGRRNKPDWKMVTVTYRWVNNHPDHRSFTTELRADQLVRLYVHPMGVGQ